MYCKVVKSLTDLLAPSEIQLKKLSGRPRKGDSGPLFRMEEAVEDLGIRPTPSARGVGRRPGGVRRGRWDPPSFPYWPCPCRRLAGYPKKAVLIGRDTSPEVGPGLAANGQEPRPGGPGCAG